VLRLSSASSRIQRASFESHNPPEIEKNLQANGKDVENTSQNRDTGHGQVNNAAAAHRGANVSKNSSIGSRNESRSCIGGIQDVGKFHGYILRD
jgi:hypothetical protein